MADEKGGLKKQFSGKIRTKLDLIFGMLISFIVILVFLTYRINTEIEKDSSALKNVEAPLNVMVEQVIGYDAMLTGNAHWALLHALKGESDQVKIHKAAYDEIGIKLDNLLKKDARALLEKSVRSQESKDKVNSYLVELDKINLALVDLELGAFAAMEQGNTNEAYRLIVGEQYYSYKTELADLYQKWDAEEAKVSDEYRQRVLENARNVRIVNIFMGILFILIASVTPFYISRSIVSPMHKLTEAAEKFGESDFSQRISIKTGDEFELLADTFNTSAKKLEKTEKEREGLEEAKTRFLSITSHELRSPMTPLKAQLQMLGEGYFGKLSQKQKDAIRIALRNTDRLNDIISDVLEITRIEAARLRFNYATINVNKTIKESLKEMSGFMREKNIKIIENIKKLPEIETDPDRILQVLRNLLNNAIKFSKKNGKVILSASKEGNYILFSVKDYGIGISPENQQLIFKPFFQEEKTIYRQYGGTGLGLVLCKGIVESQGGKIWFESKKDRGSTFYFTMPLKPRKEPKPIKLLFFPENVEKKIKEIFINYLGPMGEKEFDALKEQGIERNLLEDYLKRIVSEGILQKEKYEDMEAELSAVYSVEGPETIELAIEAVFEEIIGITGIEEFHKLRKYGFKKENIFKEIDHLVNIGTIDFKKGEEFKQKIAAIFEAKAQKRKERAAEEISKLFK